MGDHEHKIQRIFVVTFTDSTETVKIRQNINPIRSIKELYEIITSHSSTAFISLLPSTSHVILKYLDKSEGSMMVVDNDSCLRNINSSTYVYILVDIINNYVNEDDAIHTRHGNYLAIEGRTFSQIEPLMICNRPLAIAEEENAALGTGLKTWDGSVVLAKVSYHKANYYSSQQFLKSCV